MGKTKLRIESIEHKVTQANKPFVRVLTSDGWMSCFDKGIIEVLGKSVGKDVVVEVVEKNDFQNIKKVFDADTPVDEKVEVEKMDLPTRREMENNKKAGVATRYAVDLCIANKISKEEIQITADKILDIMNELS